MILTYTLTSLESIYKIVYLKKKLNIKVTQLFDILLDFRKKEI